MNDAERIPALTTFVDARAREVVAWAEQHDDRLLAAFAESFPGQLTEIALIEHRSVEDRFYSCASLSTSLAPTSATKGGPGLCDCGTDYRKVRMLRHLAFLWLDHPDYPLATVPAALVGVQHPKGPSCVQVVVVDPSRPSRAIAVTTTATDEPDGIRAKVLADIEEQAMLPARGYTLTLKKPEELDR
jgi:hypothetical protein